MWLPNGSGAGTDNSFAGGSGGYTAIPEPPTPGGFPAASQPPLTFPEKNGQFGPGSFTYLSAGYNFFTMTNPGRSA